MADRSDHDAAIEVITIGRHTHLLWDDAFIESKTHVKHEMGSVTKHADNPLIVGEEPWEGEAIFGLNVSVEYDDQSNLFKMWYESNHISDSTIDARNTAAAAIGYAESVDGVSWTKPTVGYRYPAIPGIDCEESPCGPIPDIPTNVVFQGRHGPNAFLDPSVPLGHPEKYKSAFSGLVNGGEGDFENTAIGYSADGINWNVYNEGLPVVGRAADTINQLLWDPYTNQYLLVNREDLAGDVGEGEVRGTAIYRRAGNNDLLGDPTGWEKLSVIALDRMGLDAQGVPVEGNDRQIHGTKLYTYEGMYIALASAMEGMLFSEIVQVPDPEPRHSDHIQTLYPVLSRDAVTWNTDWVYEGESLGTLIPRGGDGEWDRNQIHSATFLTRGDQHYLYYFGALRRFGDWRGARMSGIGLATLRLDGLIALSAGSTRGTVVTTPFEIAGTSLEINVNATGGRLDVEILDADGVPIPGFTAADSDDVVGDAIHQAVSFVGSSDLSSLAGRTVKLRFYMEDSKLYSFSELGASNTE